MSLFRIRIRVGPDYTRGGSRTTGFSGTSNAATELVYNTVLKRALGRAQHVATDKLLAALPKVQEDISADLVRFSQGAMRQMFTRQSPRNDSPLRFILSSPLVDGRGSTNPFVSGQRSISSARSVMDWPALAKATLRKKRPNTTFFIHTGKLKWELDDEGVFAQFMRDVLKPGLSYEVLEIEDNITKKKQTVGRLSVFVAASKKGQNLSNMPFLRTGQVSAGADQSLIARYMGEEIAMKLTNARHPDKKRPFVSPLLGFWVLQRFPFVVASSLERHLNLRIKGDGTDGSYAVGGP